MGAASAGILLWRRDGPEPEVLLGHFGGPLWANRDEGAWAIPKGLIEPGETPEACARREFEEETGATIAGPLLPLGRIRQKGGKWVEAFAAEGAFDPAALKSNLFNLVGRKLPRDGGRAIQAFLRLVGEEIAAGKADEATASIAAALEKAVGDLQTATMWLMQNGMANPNHAGAAAYPYMSIMGIVSLGLMWLRMTRASASALAAGSDDAAFHQAKLITARFFAERVMPETGALRRKLEAGADSLMALPAEAF